jgi:hypothetical protein
LHEIQLIIIAVHRYGVGELMRMEPLAVSLKMSTIQKMRRGNQNLTLTL